jgi:hypothetical protein
MSENAVLAAMRRMGIGKEEMSGHGFRAVARTILDEVLGFRRTSSSISWHTPCAIRSGACTTEQRICQSGER